MSVQNIETLKRANAALNRRDLDAAFADYHEDVQWRDLAPPPDAPERLHGLAAVRGNAELWLDVFDRFSAHIAEYVDAGECVLAVTHWHATGRGSGVDVDSTSVDVYRFADGKIVGATLGYPDRAAARAAAESVSRD